MKKILLLGIAFGFGSTAFAQGSVTKTAGLVPHKINPLLSGKTALYKKDQQKGADAVTFESIVNNLQASPTKAPVQNRAFTSTVIGSTQYQLQTNASICNRIVKSPDGTISATWTMAQLVDPWTDRGTGYNYYDGTSWGAAPLTTIEGGTRTGFTNIGITSTGEEVVVSHEASDIHVSSRDVKGTGAWRNAALGYPDVWARMAVGGANGKTVHVISQTKGSGTGGNPVFHGQDGAISYSRSLDGGLNWDKLRTIIPQIDSSHYLAFGGDDYSIDAKGDTIAIAIGGMDVDVILLKSIDNGNNWIRTVVNAFPIALYNSATTNTDVNNDGIVDTITSNDGSVAVLLDNQGQAHVWYGRMKVVCDAPGTGTGQGLSYFPFTDGLMYWNEGMGTAAPVMIAAMQDINANDSLDVSAQGTFYSSLTSQPSAGIDASGKIYLSYASLFEGIADGGSVGSGKSFRHTYVMGSTDGGSTWTSPIDLTDPDIASGSYDYLEGVYGAMAKDVDGFAHLIVQQDNSVGNGLSGTTPDVQAGPADIIYYKIPVLDIVGIQQYNKNDANISFYPNPASEKASISFTISKKENVSVNIYDITGQLITEISGKEYSAGTHSLSVNLSNYSSGIYFYAVQIGDQRTTGKMIVK